MKKNIIIFILSLSMVLTVACSKKNKTDDNNLKDNKDQNTSIETEKEEKEELIAIHNEEQFSPGEEDTIPELLDDKEPVDLSSFNSNENILYEDDLHGFTLKIPSSWKGKYDIQRETWIDDRSDSISFNYKDGNISNNIFSIVVMNESIPEDQWGELFLIYIIENDGKTFSYLNIMEPTEELLKEENKAELETVIDMVETVPDIIESFQIKK